MRSEISHTDGATVFAGPEAIQVFAAYTQAAAMRLYVKSGGQMRPTRNWTVRGALEYVRQTTGMQFKLTQLLEAAQWLVLWANAKRYDIDEWSTRNYDLGHQYAVIRWMWDDAAQVKEVVGNARGVAIFDAIDQHAKDCELTDPFTDAGVMLSSAERASRAWAVTQLTEIAKEAA